MRLVGTMYGNGKKCPERVLMSYRFLTICTLCDSIVADPETARCPENDLRTQLEGMQIYL